MSCCEHPLCKQRSPQTQSQHQQFLPRIPKHYRSEPFFRIQVKSIFDWLKYSYRTQAFGNVCWTTSFPQPRSQSLFPGLGAGRDLLVRAKLKSPESNTLRHPPGTFRCNSRHGCLTCPNIDDGRTTYTSSTTGETREIKQHITCKPNNLTYVIECKKCKKQYIGETKRGLRERFTEHRQAANNSDHASASAAVPTHFNLPSHSVKDMLLIPLELQVTNNPSRRKAREAYFTQRGHTLTPYGISR